MNSAWSFPIATTSAILPHDIAHRRRNNRPPGRHVFQRFRRIDEPRRFVHRERHQADRETFRVSRQLRVIATAEPMQILPLRESRGIDFRPGPDHDHAAFRRVRQLPRPIRNRCAHRRRRCSQRSGRADRSSSAGSGRFGSSALAEMRVIDAATETETIWVQLPFRFPNARTARENHIRHRQQFALTPDKLRRRTAEKR